MCACVRVCVCVLARACICIRFGGWGGEREGKKLMRVCMSACVRGRGRRTFNPQKIMPASVVVVGGAEARVSLPGCSRQNSEQATSREPCIKRCSESRDAFQELSQTVMAQVVLEKCQFTLGLQVTLRLALNPVDVDVNDEVCTLQPTEIELSKLVCPNQSTFPVAKAHVSGEHVRGILSR